MHRLLRTAPFVALLILTVYAFGQADTQTQPAAPATEQLDEQFVPVAADSNMYEIRSSELVLGMVTDDQELTTLAQRIIDDHTAAGDRLTEIAGTLMVEVPQQLTAESQAKIDQLQGLSGDELINAYLEQQEQAHMDAIALFTAQAENGQNEELRAFAQETLPVLQQHLEMVQSMRTARGGQQDGGQPGGGQDDGGQQDDGQM